MTPVVWTEAALAQLAAIQDYISQTSPVYADRSSPGCSHGGSSWASFRSLAAKSLNAWTRPSAR